MQRQDRWVLCSDQVAEGRSVQAMSDDPQLQHPPVPWVRERDVDLLLAESLSVDPAFVSHLLQRLDDGSWPTPDSVRLAASVGHNRPDALADASGETDVLVAVDWPSGERALISIENKVLALPQTRQGERHRRFVEGSGADFFAAVLVAPQAWLAGHHEEVSSYHVAVSLEDIAEWHEGQDEPGARWRGRVFRQAAAQRHDFEVADDLNDWCREFDQRIFEIAELRLEPQIRLRTRVSGRALSGRFIWCEAATLESLAGCDATLFFKTASAKRPGRASIDISGLPDDQAQRLLRCVQSDDGLPAAVSAYTTPSGTVIVEACPTEAKGLTMTQSVGQQEPAVAAVAQAAAGLRDWWNRLVENGRLTRR